MQKKYMRKILAVIVCVVIIMTDMMVYSPATVNAMERNYYVDAINGNDINNGFSPSSAWKTLDKVNGESFIAGDKILLKAGCVWNGILWPKGSGVEGSPIVIDMYDIGNKPIINGNGILYDSSKSDSDAVHLYNQGYWEINNLEITNTAATEAIRRGIGVNADDINTIKHIYIRNCYVHDVKGTMDSTSSGGMDIYAGSDIIVENNTIKNVYRDAIGVSTSFNGYSGVFIRNNVVEDVGGNGIVVCSSNSPVVEHNVAKNCNNRYKLGVYNVAIWPFACNDAIFQYNEAYLTRNTNDGQGFDCDYLCNGTIFQYNYSHDNEGGFMLVCGVPNAPSYESYNRNSIIRYNISQNDKTRIFQIHSKETRDTLIYNNTIYIGAGTSPSIYAFEIFRPAGTTYSYNNLFYNAGNGRYTWGAQNYHIFSNNAFFGYHSISEPSDPYKITADPMLVNAGSGGIGVNSVGGYKLRSNSPLINSGKYITDNGGKDYWGNSLYNGTPDIGAHEYSDEAFSQIIPEIEGTKILHSTTDTGEEQINYVGTWSSNTNEHWSNEAGAHYEVSFTGRQAKVCGSIDPNHGIMAVSVDGQPEILVDTYADVRKDTVLYTTGLLSYGQHTIKVRVTGTGNANSSNSYINVKHVEILPKWQTVPSFKAGAREGFISYNNGWYHGDSDSWSRSRNSYYEMTFEGTQLRLVGAKDSSYGIIALSIDGGAETLIDLYSLSRQTGIKLYISDALTPGKHNIRVRVTGSKNSASMGIIHSIEKLEYRPLL